MLLGKYVPVGSLSDADLSLPVTTATAIPIPSQLGVSNETITTDLAITSVESVSAQVEKTNDMTSIFTEISTEHSNFSAPSHSTSKHTLKRPLELQQVAIPATKTANYAVSFNDEDEEGSADDEGDVQNKVQKLSSSSSSSSTVVGIRKAPAAAAASIIHRDIFASDVNTAPLTAGETESTHHRKFPKGSKGSGDGGDKPPLSRKQQQDIDKRRAGNSTSSSPKLNRAARRALGKGE